MKRMKNKAREERLVEVLKERSEERCEYCGRLSCDAGHILPREYLKTKYVLENLLHLCRECHIKFDNNREFREKIIKVLIGQEKYNNLVKIAKGKATVGKYKYTEIE